MIVLSLTRTCCPGPTAAYRKQKQLTYKHDETLIHISIIFRPRASVRAAMTSPSADSAHNEWI
jgi:hypothetical protein